MKLSVIFVFFLSAIAGAHARLGPGRTLSTNGTNASQQQSVECAQGYTCWKDESGNLWAKRARTSTTKDCDAVCSSAFSMSPAFHSCKQGVNAPKSTHDITEVAAGLNFDCSGSKAHFHHTPCWGSNTPPSLSGTILVTGDDQISKNCFFPSAATLSCDEPVANANCFGERFTPVCPCVEEEELIVLESKKWRLYTNSDYPKTGPTWSWDLDNISYFSSLDCSGDPLNSSDGTKITDSGNGGVSYTPERAFGDKSPGRWGGRKDNGVDGNLWIAIEFVAQVDVGCVKFDQFNNYAQYIKLQAIPAGSTTWETVKAVKDGHKGTNTISL